MSNMPSTSQQNMPTQPEQQVHVETLKVREYPCGIKVETTVETYPGKPDILVVTHRHFGAYEKGQVDVVLESNNDITVSVLDKCIAENKDKGLPTLILFTDFSNVGNSMGLGRHRSVMLAKAADMENRGIDKGFKFSIGLAPGGTVGMWVAPLINYDKNRKLNTKFVNTIKGARDAINSIIKQIRGKSKV